MTEFRYKELDALRGIAALFVVFFHLTMDTTFSDLGFKFGVTGVDLFFIISGFVIFMSINKVSLTREFLINRFSRLYPTYWTCVTLTFLLRLVVAQVNARFPANLTFSTYVGNLTMFQYYLGIEDLDDPYWTMMVEMLFYLGISILFYTKILRHILTIGLSLLGLLALIHLSSVNPLPILVPMNKVFPLMAHFPLFLSGIIFYKLKNAPSIGQQTYFLYACLPFCFVVQLWLFGAGGLSRYYLSVSEYFISLLSYYALFILFIHNQLRFLVTKPLLFFGKISFALYLVHQYLSLHFLIPWLVNYAHSNYYAAVAITFSTVILFANVITYKIEIPVGKKLNHFLRRILMAGD